MAGPARLRRLIRRFAGQRVLVIGDLMLDQFVWGDVSRISPEAPVPIVRVRRQEVRPGGAANVVTNVVALGGRAAACGLVGRDPAGRQLRAVLARAGSPAGGLVTSGTLTTTAKTRVVAHGQQVVRFDHDPDGEVPARLVGRLVDWVRREARRFAVVVVSDYGKGVVGPELLGELARLRERHGFAYLIDPKRTNFPHYRRATLVKPNVVEASAASGVDIVDRRTLEAAGRRLLERWEADAVLISRGEAGMALFQRGARPRLLPTAAHEVYDVTGAGDTVLAACALALAAGGSLADAATLANHAAGVVVGKVGTATVSARELARAVREED